MARITRVRRVANPRRRRAHRSASGRFVKRSGVKRTSARTRRRKSSAPAIRRYSVKSIRKELKRRGVKSNPTRRRARAVKRRTRRRTVRRHRQMNPVLLELGALNPRKRSNTMARKIRRRRAVNRRRSHRRRRHNPVMVVSRRRRHNARRSRGRRRTVRHYSRRRRSNPMGIGGRDMLTLVGGGLLGMAATKFLPAMFPQVTASLGNTPIMNVVITGAGAFVAGWLAEKFISPAMGRAVLTGGLIQTGSTALNAFAPGLASALSLSGVGDIIPTSGFSVPQNSVRPPVVALPAAGMNGMGAGLRRRGVAR